MNNKWKNVLEKIRPDHTENKQAKTVERVQAIGHSCEAIGWRPVGDTTPKQFQQFLNNLHTDIEGFISKTNPDKYNACFYVNTVESELALALKELEMQRTEHKRSIHNIRIYQKASLTDLENYLKQLEEALAKNKEVL